MLNFTFPSSESGRASPSTREAIAGMLSMSRVVPSGRQPSTRKNTSSTRHPKPRRRYEDEDNMSKVHQDEDYGMYVICWYSTVSINCILEDIIGSAV